MANYSFEALQPGYKKLWDEAKVTKVDAATKQAQLVLRYKAFLKETEKRTGVPWWAVGIMHLREAGPQDFGKWKAVLHNGESIIGTGRKTSLVPKGRGPFNDWQTAAYDALVTLKGFNRIKDWTPERVAYVLETFNGFGYRQYGIPSPYLWGGSSVQKRGKYVSDGKYDRNVMDTQLGGMTVLKQLLILDPTIKFGVQENTPAVTSTVIGGGTAATMVATPVEYWPYILGAGIALAIVGYFATKWYMKRKEKDV